MKIFFGTVIRAAPVRQGGELVKLDWQTKKIQAKVPIYPDNPSLDNDPNPRGNSRGCRGIGILGKEVIATSYHTVKVYDFKLNHKRDLSHGLMVGLHEIFINSNGKIWVSATAIDAALEFDLSGAQENENFARLVNEFWPREIPSYQTALNIKPLNLDRKCDLRSNFLGEEHIKNPSHLHLNAISKWHGELFALFNAFGVVANLTRGEVVVKDPALKGGHNLLIKDDGIAICNDTHGRTIRLYDLSTGKLLDFIDITSFSWVKSLEKRSWAKTFVKRTLKKMLLRDSSVARPLFVRGMDRAKNLLFIGLSPASILCIDLNKKDLVDAYCYSKRVEVCIHGLSILKE